jgi:hypothetical protein
MIIFTFLVQFYAFVPILNYLEWAIIPVQRNVEDISFSPVYGIPSR